MENETNTQPADLTINDLNSLKVLIDLASSRGAFKPSEMVIIGQTYSRLTAFLDYVAKQQELNKTQESVEETVEETN